MRKKTVPNLPRSGTVWGLIFGPQTLIHRNKVPKPASMRVTARFDAPEGIDLATIQKTVNFAAGPVGQLMIRRLSDGR